MQDQYLTPHFQLSEFVNSSTATRLGIDNSIPESYIPRLKTICEQILEPLRTFANQPITIGSGYRCPALNKAVGGVKNSQHQFGEAADIHLPDEQTGREWFLWIMDNLQFDQLIWEGSCKPSGTTSSLDCSRGAAEARRSQKSTPKSKHHWIHVSYREGHCRQQVIRNLVKNR